MYAHIHTHTVLRVYMHVCIVRVCMYVSPHPHLTPVKHILLYVSSPPSEQQRTAVQSQTYCFCSGSHSLTRIWRVRMRISYQFVDCPDTYAQCPLFLSRASQCSCFLSLARSRALSLSLSLSRSLSFALSRSSRNTTDLVWIRFRSHESRLRDRNAQAFVAWQRHLQLGKAAAKPFVAWLEITYIFSKKKYRVGGIGLFPLLFRLLQIFFGRRRKQPYLSAILCILHLNTHTCVCVFDCVLECLCAFVRENQRK